MIWGVIICVLVNALETMTYLIKEPETQDIPTDWIVNIRNKCPDASLDEAFSARSEIQNGLVAMGFGAYFGQLAYSYKRPGN